MSLRRPTAIVAFVCCIITVFAIGLPALHAAGPSADEGIKAVKADLQTQVQALLKMSPEARRGELKKMSPEQRRSLWFELKREQHAAEGRQMPTGEYRRPGNTIKAPAKSAARQPKPAPKAGLLGTIQYDDGVPTANFGGGAIIGNRFNTAVGNPIATSGTISTVVGVVQQGAAFTSPTAGFVIEGPQTAGGGANAIFSTWTNGLTASTETVTYSGLGVNYTGDSFFVLFGDWPESYIPAFGTGTTQAQGHHGVVGYTGGTGPNITSTFDFAGTLNGLVRVTGNVLPVELISFDVD